MGGERVKQRLTEKERAAWPMVGRKGHLLSVLTWRQQTRRQLGFGGVLVLAVIAAFILGLAVALLA